MSAAQVYEFNVPTFGKGVVFDVDHKVRPCPTLLRSQARAAQHLTPKYCFPLTEQGFKEQRGLAVHS